MAFARSEGAYPDGVRGAQYSGEEMAESTGVEWFDPRIGSDVYLPAGEYRFEESDPEHAGRVHPLVERDDASDRDSDDADRRPRAVDDPDRELLQHETQEREREGVPDQDAQRREGPGEPPETFSADVPSSSATIAPASRR